MKRALIFLPLSIISFSCFSQTFWQHRTHNSQDQFNIDSAQCQNETARYSATTNNMRQTPSYNIPDTYSSNCTSTGYSLHCTTTNDADIYRQTYEQGQQLNRAYEDLGAALG